MKYKKSAFTLVEILVVISIIAVLVGMTVAMLGSSSKSQNAARAKADMSNIATALEAFNTKYLSYPRISCDTSEEANAALLYQYLTGQKRLAFEDGSVVEYDASEKTLIDVSTMKIADAARSENPDPEGMDTFFVDPWGEPYIYMYDTSDVAGDDDSSTWESSTFLLFSKGEDTEKASVGDVYSTGLLDDVKFYKSNEKNKDNIINGID